MPVFEPDLAGDGFGGDVANAIGQVDIGGRCLQCELAGGAPDFDIAGDALDLDRSSKLGEDDIARGGVDAELRLRRRFNGPFGLAACEREEFFPQPQQVILFG